MYAVFGLRSNARKSPFESIDFLDAYKIAVGQGGATAAEVP